MTKANIVQRLLDERVITAEEAVVLLTEKIIEVEKVVEIEKPRPFNPWDIIGPGIYPQIEQPEYPLEIIGDNDMVPYGEICSCNPKNGGSGICGCIMANKLVPRNGGTRTVITTGDLTIRKSCPNGPGPCLCTGDCK